jgi:hypothetical protein
MASQVLFSLRRFQIAAMAARIAILGGPTFLFWAYAPEGGRSISSLLGAMGGRSPSMLTRSLMAVVAN